MEILIEAIGYLGTAVVLVSMLMTSITKLRIVNICGGALSTAYAILVGAMPVVLLNVAAITINAVQLLRARKGTAAEGKE